MKKVFLFIMLIGAMNSCLFAQMIKNDTIVKVNGERIVVKVVNNSENSIIFSYPGESMTTTLSKNLISEIIYASGRKEKLSDKIVINSEKDWEKVKLTSQNNEIEGLVKKGDLEETSKYLGLYTPAKSANEKIQTKMKKSAAKIGAHIVLISPMTTSASQYRMTGIAYGYK